MSVKIAVTWCSIGGVIHGGGDPQRETAIIELRDDQVPEVLKEYIEYDKQCREESQYSYQSVVFSLVKE